MRCVSNRHTLMCSLFPTEVSCTVETGGIAKGSVDVKNMICLLSNNLFNQYFFLVLWCWWVIILVLSSLGLVYRLAQLVVPQLGRYVPDEYFSYNPRHDSLNLRTICGQCPKYACLMKNILSRSSLLLIQRLIYLKV